MANSNKNTRATATRKTQTAKTTKQHSKTKQRKTFLRLWGEMRDVNRTCYGGCQ